MRKYPPGSALYFNGKCLCGRLHETINGYIMPLFRSDNKIIPDDSKSKMMETLSDDRIVGNYGSLVFSANVRTLNSLKEKHEDQYVCCNCVNSSPSSNKIHANRTKDKLLPDEIASKVHEEFSNQAADKVKCVEFPLIPLNVSTEIDIEISMISPVKTQISNRNITNYEANNLFIITVRDSERNGDRNDSKFGNESTAQTAKNDTNDRKYTRHGNIVDQNKNNMVFKFHTRKRQTK